MSPRPNRHVILLHRVIVERILGRALKTGELGEHRDGDPMNCTRENLRVATQGQNLANAKKRPDGHARYKGIYYHSDGLKKPWVARIGHLGLLHHLGLFATETEAARAYNVAALRLYGEFARLNDV
jgi:hypothetical protein